MKIIKKEGLPLWAKKFIYYVDESVVFAITVLAIIFSDALQAILKGNSHPPLVAMSIAKILTSSFIAVMVHGAINSSFKYNERDKPPIFKRIYTSVFVGMSWKTVVNSALPD